MLSVSSLTAKLEESECAKHKRAHVPGNPICCGTASFTGTVVYNWRVLWWSLPWVSRKEHVVKLFRDSWLAHRETGLPIGCWRMQFTFLGQNVCREAFMALTGFGASFLQWARGAAQENTVSWATPGERVMHGGLITNTAKATSYLGARQWLEAYADTHSEWSPMDGRAYLPAGRKGFYYYHYRTDMMERHRGLGETSR